MQEHNDKEKAQDCFMAFGFKVVTGGRYLGGFIGDQAEQREWVAQKASTWAEGILKLSKVVVGRYPQAAYAGLQKSRQQEWQLLQRVTS